MKENKGLAIRTQSFRIESDKERSILKTYANMSQKKTKRKVNADQKIKKNIKI